MADASAAEFPGGTRNPVSPESIRSGMPPISLATMAFPDAMASIITVAQASGPVQGSTPNRQRFHACIDGAVRPGLEATHVGPEFARSLGETPADQYERRGAFQTMIGLEQNLNPFEPHHVADEKDERLLRQLCEARVSRAEHADIIRYEVRYDLERHRTVAQPGITGDGTAYGDEAINRAVSQNPVGESPNDCNRSFGGPIVCRGAGQASHRAGAFALVRAPMHVILLRANKAIVMERYDKAWTAHPLHRQIRSIDPIVGVNDVGPFLRDDAPQSHG